eukprot:m.26834 g.26834  ORF g.26834 m.26834 type:complete len:692 (-) comp4672_c0_seq1:180-2255(-)
MTDWAELSTELASMRRIDRDKALARFCDILGVKASLHLPAIRRDDALPFGGPQEPIDPAVVAAAEEALLGLLEPTDVWERNHGGLMAATVLAKTGCASDAFAENVAKRATEMLCNKEFRIRIEAGITLAAMCAAKGIQIYERFAQQTILSCIEDNLERKIDENTPTQMQVDEDGKQSPLLHESAGWKTLESGCKALLEVVKATTNDFAPYLTHHLLDLLFESLKHTNRFVRETSYLVCAELTTVLQYNQAAVQEGISGDDFCKRMAPQLAVGLADNWSQVRMAAGVAARQFLLSLPAEKREEFYSVLLPRLCLNRYYVAEGVRLFSQETWRLIVGEHGRELVEKYIAETVDFYISQTEADNHAVREAACACIAELGKKVNGACIRPQVAKLLKALLDCFRDESWPVRDAACIASGRFIECFPEEARDMLPQFYELFFQHVGDNIWSVRENAAIGLAAVVRAYGQESFDYVLPRIKEMLVAIQKQPEQSTANVGLHNETIFGVAPPAERLNDAGGPTGIKHKHSHDNDDAHTNQQMYSCGSLAPRLKRKGGCMDHGFQRPQEPWEQSDGCIYFMREMAQAYPQQIAELLPLLAEATQLRHFKHHLYYLETTWKQLPAIARGVGKRFFKQHLELFFDSMLYSLKGSHHLSQTAAEGCVQQLSKFLGPSIFQGRVELFNPSVWPTFEQALRAPM